MWHLIFFFVHTGLFMRKKKTQRRLSAPKVLNLLKRGAVNCEDVASSLGLGAITCGPVTRKCVVKIMEAKNCFPKFVCTNTFWH